MRKHETIPDELENLADDAKALLAATADVAEEKVIAARKRLASALENGKHVWETVQEKAIDGAKAADKTIRSHPYESIGIAFGLGALIGYLISRRN